MEAWVFFIVFLVIIVVAFGLYCYSMPGGSHHVSKNSGNEGSGELPKCNFGAHIAST